MARLIGLPAYDELMRQAKIEKELSGQRIGQFVWNRYGLRGIDGNGWPELFYADDEKAIKIIQNHYMNWGS